MAYITGSVLAVPRANKALFLNHIQASWPLFQRYGATRLVENWSDAPPRGQRTDFYRAVAAQEDEAIAFSWIEWPDKAQADAAWAQMAEDPAMQSLPPNPFDGSRMIFGGFDPVFSGGSQAPAGHYQGFVLAVPQTNRDAYIAMAAQGWAMFAEFGALGMVECWGNDVPQGKQTDFYRATLAEPGEVVLFSWVLWPDAATCAAAAKAMEASMAEAEMPAMPFDAGRMFWADFTPLFDSAENAGAKG